MSESDNKSSSDNEILSERSESEEMNVQFMKKVVALFESGSSKVTGDRSTSPSDVNNGLPHIKHSTSSLNLNKLAHSSKNLTNSSNNNSASRPKKIGRKILGELKTKKRNFIQPINMIKKKVEFQDKNVRKDKNGTVINKKNKKKVKITFKTPFEDVQKIESYKKYNLMLGLPRSDNFGKQSANCQCQACQIW